METPDEASQHWHTLTGLLLYVISIFVHWRESYRISRVEHRLIEDFHGFP